MSGGDKHMIKKYPSVKVIAAITVLLFELAESFGSPPHTSIEWLFAIQYAILILLFPFVTDVSCIGLIVLSITGWLLPFDILGPSNFWGTWLALIALAYRKRIMFSVIGAGATMIAVLLQDMSKVGTSRAGIVSLALSYAGAVLVGYILRSVRVITEQQAREDHLKEELEYAQDREYILHIVHDDAAGALTRIFLSSRQNALDPDVESYSRNKFLEISSAASIAAQRLRQNIIEPIASNMQKGDKGLYQSHNLNDNIPQVNSVTNAVSYAQSELASLGYLGTPRIEGDPELFNPMTAHLLVTAICELSLNVIKYGQPGPYAFSLNCRRDSCDLMVSNHIKTPSSKQHQPMGTGLSLLKNNVEEMNGTIRISQEDGDWTVFLRLPTPSDQRPV